MTCAVHADRDAIHTVDGRPACEECALQSALLIGVSVAYLAALAVGLLVFKSRALVGGLAAMVALFSGRFVQIQLERRGVDAARSKK